MTEEQVALALTIDCPHCGELPGAGSRNSLGHKKNQPHWRRLWRAE